MKDLGYTYTKKLLLRIRNSKVTGRPAVYLGNPSPASGVAEEVREGMTRPPGHPRLENGQPSGKANA